MKTIGIAVTDTDDWTCVALFKACKQYGMHPVKFNLSDITSDIASGNMYSGKIDLTKLDGVIVRDMGPSTQKDISFRFDILCQLRDMGVSVVNSPDAIARAANKYVSSYLFQRNGIPTPKTLVANNLNSAREALAMFGRAVVKPVFGYKGKGLECVRDSAGGRKKLKELMERNSLVYIQEFIPNPGRDIRVFVVDGQVAGSIYRTAPAGGWINNLSQGGSGTRCKVTDPQKRMSLKAAKVVGTVYAGVDIIEGDRDYVIEINGTPSGKGIWEGCGVDVTLNIVEYLERSL